MSKAAAPCSSCPSSKTQPSSKASSLYTSTIDCVLEDVLPVNTDSVVKVKKFKKFLDHDLKTLNITGKLETNIHKNGLTQTKMIVTYKDKKTNKVNHLEINAIDNTNKKVESTIKKAENTSKQSRVSGCPPAKNSYPAGCTVTSCTASSIPGYPIFSYTCPNDSVINGVVSSSTEAGSRAIKKLDLGSQIVVDIKGRKYAAFSVDKFAG